MATRNVTLGFAGSADTTLENVKDLLGDFLHLGPEDDNGFPEIPEDLGIRIVFPLSSGHISKGLLQVLDWTEYADLQYTVLVDPALAAKKRKSQDESAFLEYAEAVDSVEDPNKYLIQVLKEDQDSGAEVHLMLLWGEGDSDDNCEILLDLADSHQIPVKDLTAGLDDLKFTDEPDEVAAAPEPEPIPEPEPEKPAQRGRRRPQEVQEKPLREQPESVEEDVRKAVAAKVAEPEADDILVRGLALKHDIKRREVNRDIYNRFSVYPTSPEIETTRETLRRVSLEYAHYLNELLPDSREKSLALTAVQQAHAWGTEAITLHAYHAVADQQAPDFLDGLRQGYVELAQQQAQEAPERPSRGRGRPRADGSPTQPRTAAEKAVVEIYDEEAEEWVRKGRGRVPKDVRTRLVDPKTGEPVDAVA